MASEPDQMGRTDRGETGGPPEGKPAQNLTAGDIARVLRRLPADRFASLVQAAADGTSPQPGPAYGHLRRRPADEPDPGATEQLDISASGLRVAIMTVGGTREGHVSWPQVIRWIRAGITRHLADGYATAYQAATAFRTHDHGVLVLGQAARHADIVRELDTILRDAAHAITSAAMAASPPGWPATPVRSVLKAPGSQLSLDLSAGEAHLIPLERISQLMAELDGPSRPGHTVPAAELRAGTAIHHPGRTGQPIVLNADADISGDRIPVPGEARSRDQPPQAVRPGFPGEGTSPVTLARPAGQPLTDDDACRAIARLGPRAIAQLARGDEPDITGRLSLDSSELDLAAGKAARSTIMVTPAGLEIEIADTPVRAGAVSWPRAEELVRLGLTPGHGHALLMADETLQRLDTARKGFALIGEEAIALQARDDLYAIAEQAAQGIITQAMRKSTGRMASRAAPEAAAPGTWQERAIGSAISRQSSAWAVQWTERVAAALPPSSSYNEIPVSRLSTGDVFLRPGGGPGQMLCVLGDPVVTAGAVEVSASAVGPAAAALAAETVTWGRVPGQEMPVMQVMRLPRSLADLYPQDYRYQAGVAPPAGLPGAASGREPADVAKPQPPAADPPTPGPAARTDGDGDLRGELAGVLAAIADHRHARATDGTGTTVGSSGSFEPIWAAFASLRRELGLPTAGTEPAGHVSAPVSPGHRQPPLRTRPESAARGSGAGGWADIRQAFGELRLALDLPPAEAGTPGPAESADTDRLSAEALRGLDDAIAEAAASASWFASTAEWRRIARITAAAGSLVAAIRESAADYWADIRRDVRVRGFLRTVAARTCRAIAQSARELARVIARRGRQGSAAWRAAHRLHQAAALAGDRLMGYIPPGSGRRMREVQEIIDAMPRASRPSPSPGPRDPSCPAALAGSSFPRGGHRIAAVKTRGQRLAAATAAVGRRTDTRPRR